MNFKQKATSIFLDPSVKPFFIEGKVNVILSPSLYWFKKVSLPLKSVRELKKLLPSIFEDELDDGNYSYSAYKSGDDFYAFAYDDKLIIDTIVAKGLALSDVAGVYFAQSELYNISKSITIDAHKALYVKDGVVIIIPTAWMGESTDLNLRNITLSKHKVTLKEYGHIVDSSNLFKIVAALLFLIVLAAGKYMILSQKIDEIESQRSELFTKYGLQPTMMQNRSVLNSYKKIYEKQNRLRQTLLDILSLPLQPTQRLTSLVIKGDHLTAGFELQSGAKEENIIAALKRKNIDFKADRSENTLHVKVAL